MEDYAELLDQGEARLHDANARRCKPGYLDVFARNPQAGEFS
jgi:hypothetical protein